MTHPTCSTMGAIDRDKILDAVAPLKRGKWISAAIACELPRERSETDLYYGPSVECKCGATLDAYQTHDDDGKPSGWFIPYHPKGGDEEARAAIEERGNTAVDEAALAGYAAGAATISDIHGPDAAHRSLIDRMKADADGQHCPSVGAWIDHLQGRARLAEHERDEAMVHVAKLGLERDAARQQLAAIHAAVNTDAEGMSTLDYVNDLKSEIGGLADALDKCMRERDEALTKLKAYTEMGERVALDGEAADRRIAELAASLRGFVERNYRKVYLGDHVGYDGGFVAEWEIEKGRAALSPAPAARDPLGFNSLKGGRTYATTTDLDLVLKDAKLTPAQETNGKRVVAFEDAAEREGVNSSNREDDERVAEAARQLLAHLIVWQTPDAGGQLDALCKALNAALVAAVVAREGR